MEIYKTGNNTHSLGQRNAKTVGDMIKTQNPVPICLTQNTKSNLGETVKWLGRLTLREVVRGPPWKKAKRITDECMKELAARGIDSEACNLKRKNA